MGSDNENGTGELADFDIVESQRVVISLLLEVVRKMQDNDALGEEYLHIATKGMLRARAKRTEQILRQRQKNTEAINTLLSRIEPLK